MRILFFSIMPLNGSNIKGYNGGGWIASLIENLSKLDNQQIAVGFWGCKDKKEEKKIVTYQMQDYSYSRRFGKLRKIASLLGPFTSQGERKSWTFYENKMLSIINDFKPDIIYVFGSEQQFGLIASKTKIPVILHIQGIINPYLNAFLPPFMSLRSQYTFCHPIKSLREYMVYKAWKMSGLREIEILSRVHNYIGRTTWDKRIVDIFNSSAKYFYGSEILREAFYEEANRTIPLKLTIISTISSPFYKGFDMVLKTANILKNNYRLEFEWLVFGNVNCSVIENIVHLKHRDIGIILKGVASPNELKKNILNSTVYVHPSYIDNSPNSVCEAQILGGTVIATNVGGVSSIVEDCVSGFLVPANDPFQTAYLIKELFNNNELNMTIGKNAREIALKRHNRKSIVDNLLNICNELVV